MEEYGVAGTTANNNQSGFNGTFHTTPWDHQGERWKTSSQRTSADMEEEYWVAGVTVNSNQFRSNGTFYTTSWDHKG